jgi:hypothetical protein
VPVPQHGREALAAFETKIRKGVCESRGPSAQLGEAET